MTRPRPRNCTKAFHFLAGVPASIDGLDFVSVGHIVDEESLDVATGRAARVSSHFFCWLRRCRVTENLNCKLRHHLFLAIEFFLLLLRGAVFYISGRSSVTLFDRCNTSGTDETELAIELDQLDDPDFIRMGRLRLLDSKGDLNWFLDVSHGGSRTLMSTSWSLCVLLFLLRCQ